MNVAANLEELSTVLKRISVEVPAAAVGEEFDRIVAEYRRHARVPGFRKGKAPVGLVKRHYRDDIRGDLFNKIVPDAYNEALKDLDVSPLHQPNLEGLKFEEGEPLTFSAEFEVAPKFELPRYHGLPVSVPPHTPSVEDLEKELERLREEKASMEAVEDRPAEAGDFVVIDLNGVFRPDEEKPKREPISQEGVNVELGAVNTLAEFSEALTGMNIAEEKTFEVTYPDDYHDKNLAGRTIDFTVEVFDIKKKVLPELDDEFARDLGECETLEELKTSTMDRLREEADRTRDADVRDKTVEALVEQTDFEIPRILLERRLDEKLKDFAMGIAARGVDPAQAGVDWKSLREGMRETAEKEVRASLILADLAEAEGISVSDEEIEEEIQRMAAEREQPTEAVRQYFDNKARREDLRGQLLHRKVVDFLVNQAEITTLEHEPAAE